MYLQLKKQKIEVVVADSFSKRLIGLMGKKNINYGMIFPKCNAIHTFNMRENIDIVGLNSNNEVIYKYQNLPKNRVIKVNNPKNKTSILELPKNASQDIKINSILLFKDEHEI